MMCVHLWIKIRMTNLGTFFMAVRPLRRILKIEACASFVFSASIALRSVLCLLCHLHCVAADELFLMLDGALCER